MVCVSCTSVVFPVCVEVYTVCAQMHAAVYVMQVVSDLVGDWQTKHHRWGVSKKKLANAVWEVAWRRHVEGPLTHHIYFPQPAVFSQEGSRGGAG